MYIRGGPLSAAGLCPQMPSFMQLAINCYAQTMSCPGRFYPDTIIIIHAIQCLPSLSFDSLCGQLFSMEEKLHWLTARREGGRLKLRSFVCYLKYPAVANSDQAEHTAGRWLPACIKEGLPMHCKVKQEKAYISSTVLHCK